jgi:hypothetical protein
VYVCSINDCPDIDGFKVAAMAMPHLAAATMIEALFTAYSCTNLSLRGGFLSKLATEASQQQHGVSRRVEDILRRLTAEPGLQGSSTGKTLPEDGAQLFLKHLLFNIVDLSSMAAISRPDLIIKRWISFECKRKWVYQYKSSPISRELQASRASNQERSKPSLLSLASKELEFDERIGNYRGAHGTFSSSGQSLRLLYVHVLLVNLSDATRIPTTTSLKCSVT